MRHSILHALFDGNVIPWERPIPMSAERMALETKIESEKQYFMESISSDDRKRFEELTDMYAEVSFDEDNTACSYGFTLGALLMMEVMEKKEAMIRK